MRVNRTCFLSQPPPPLTSWGIGRGAFADAHMKLDAQSAHITQVILLPVWLFCVVMFCGATDNIADLDPPFGSELFCPS